MADSIHETDTGTVTNHAFAPVRPTAHEQRGTGLRVERVFTTAGGDPYDSI